MNKVFNLLNSKIINISLLDEAILSDKLETFRKTKPISWKKWNW